MSLGGNSSDRGGEVTDDGSIGLPESIVRQFQTLEEDEHTLNKSSRVICHGGGKGLRH